MHRYNRLRLLIHTQRKRDLSKQVQDVRHSRQINHRLYCENNVWCDSCRRMILNPINQILWKSEAYCEDFELTFWWIGGKVVQLLINFCPYGMVINSIWPFYCPKYSAMWTYTVLRNRCNKIHSVNTKQSWLNTNAYFHSLIPRPNWQTRFDVL